MGWLIRRIVALALIVFLLAVLLGSHNAQRASCERSGGRLVHIDGGHECWHGVIPW